MILVEVEPTLPVVVEAARAQVIACLCTNHAIHEYETVPELVAYLDRGLLELAERGYPPYLSRITLFYKTASAHAAVAARMAPGFSFESYKAPACWQAFAAQLPALTRLARQFDPTFSTSRR